MTAPTPNSGPRLGNTSAPGFPGHVRPTPHRSARLVVAVAITVTLGLVACGDDDGAPGITVPGGPGADAGVPPDAGLDGGRVREYPDAASGDPCEVDADSLYDLVATSAVPDVAPLSVLPGSSRFGLAFIDASETCVDALYLAELRGGRGEGGPAVMPAVDACSAIERGTLASFGESWLLASVDNREPPTDIWVQAFDPDADEPASAHRVTQSGQREQALALAAYDDGRAMLAWVARDVMTGVESLAVRPLGAGGRPSGDPVVLDGGGTWILTLPTLSRVGAYMGLAYHRYEPEGRSQTVLEVLDPDTGERVRDTWVLSEDAGPQPTIALAADAEGGAVLYSRAAGGSGRQLWFQKLDQNGVAAPTMSGTAVGAPSEPQRIVNAPMRGIDGSIAKLVTGFAVAYRALPDATSDTPRVRLYFLDRFGRVFGDSEVAETTATGGRTSIAFSVEGRMVVGWSDRSEAGQTTVRMARIPCVGDN